MLDTHAIARALTAAESGVLRFLAGEESALKPLTGISCLWMA